MSRFRTQRRNANKHTQRGLGALESSIQKDGWIGAQTAAADGEIFDGSARLEVAEDKFEGVEPIVVESDGKRPIIVKRTDIPNADDPRARRLSYAANRVHELDTSWDTLIISEDYDAAPEILEGLWTYTEIAMTLGQGEVIDPNAEWQGMPEFEQKHQLGIKTIYVHFDSLEAVDNFAQLVEQEIGAKTKFIWYPKQKQVSSTEFAYSDES